MNKPMERARKDRRKSRTRRRPLGLMDVRQGMESLEDRCLLATLSWVGDVNNLWSTDVAGNTNWSGDLLPAAGDTLVFPATGANQNNVNDTAANTAYRLQFTGGNYTISGNAITLTSGGISDSTTGGITTNINLDGLIVASDTGFNVVNASETLRITSPISGVNAVLFKTGAGTVEYAQAVDNTFPGSTRVNNGTLRLNSATFDGAIVGPLIVGDNVGAVDSAVVELVQSAEIGSSVPVTVNSDGLFVSFIETIGNLTVNQGRVDTGNDVGLEATGTISLTGASIFGNASLFLRSGSPISVNASATTSTISSEVDLVLDTTFDVADGAAPVDLSITGNITGDGDLTKTGPGVMHLSGDSNYTGETLINAGTLEIASNNALGSTVAGTTVNAPAVLALTGGIDTSEPLTLNGPSTVVNVAGINILGGPITLLTDLVLDIDAGERLVLDNAISGGNITKLGPGTLTFADFADFPGTTTIQAGVVEANANPFFGNSIGPIVLDGGTLRGIGRTGDVTSTANGGVVAPGLSVGVLFTGTLNWNAATTLDEEIDGGAADQIVVTGAVNLGDALLNVIILTGPPPGSNFTIISNDGADPINGLFTSNAINPQTGLPAGTLTEGEVFEVGGTFFQISYIGGDGNDITLAVVGPPVARDDTYVFFETQPSPFPTTFISPLSILDNDSDPDTPRDRWVPVLFTSTSNGELVLRGDGFFEYTPNPGFNGVDSFTYFVYDGTVPPTGDPDLPPTTNPPGPEFGLFYSNLATVTIFVNPVNYDPVANPDVYSFDQSNAGPTTGLGDPGDPFVYQLHVPAPGILGNDFSPENLDSDDDNDVTLTPILVSGPTNGILVTSGGVTLVTNDTITDGTDAGAFFYRPNTGFSGTDTFTYQLVDSNGLVSGTTTVTLFIAPLNYFRPQGQDDAYAVNEDDTLFVTGPGVLANDTDLDGDFLTAVIDTLPTNGTVILDAGGGFLYTPDANYNGPDSFTYRAFDGTNFSDPITVTITVRPVADAPVAFDDSYFVTEDTTLTAPPAPLVTANDLNPDGNPLTVVQVGPGPANAAAFTLNPDGTFTYTPLPDFVGTDFFNYYLLDPLSGLTSGIATVTITVQAANDPPIARDNIYVTNEDTTLTVPAPGVLANDTDPEGDPLTAVLATLPTNGIVTLNPDGSFTYVPNANFFGTDSFTYFAWDNTQPSAAPATVTITVNPIVDRPTAANDSYSVLEDTLLTITSPGILVNDTNPDDPTFGTTFTNTQIVVVNGPLHGTLGGNILNAPPNNGAFTYQPNANFFGTDSFTYFIRNTITGSTSDTATVTINVVPVPDLPVGNPDAFTTNEDVVLHVAGPGVLKNDVNVDHDELNAVVIDGPSNGRVVLNSDGSFDYFPDENFNGTDTFTYVPVNGAGQGNTTTVTITVRPVNDRPVARDDSYTMQEDDTLTVPAPGILGNDTDADGETLTAVLVNNVQNGTLTLNADGSFTYVPNADFVGTDSFTYRATDGTLESNLATVTINVQAIAPTTINLDPASDTGVSDTDRITKDNTPTFFGTTVPNLLVRLYVRPFGSTGAPIQVGQDMADSQGNWRITSNLLPDGRHEFFVAAFRANGQTTGRVIEFGTLTVDTVAPRVTSAILSPKTGQVYIAFQDNMTGMAQPNIGNVANYTFAKIFTHAPRAFAVNSATALPFNLPTDPQTVVLDVFGGRNAGHGRYLFAAISGAAFPNGVGGIADVAGNALDGEFNGTLPSGNGQAGSDFQAQFNTNGNDITLASPATEFVPYFLALNNSTPVPSIPFNLARSRTRISNGLGNGGLLPLQGTRKLGAARQARAARLAQGGGQNVAPNFPDGPLSRRLRGN